MSEVKAFEPLMAAPNEGSGWKPFETDRTSLVITYDDQTKLPIEFELLCSYGLRDKITEGTLTELNHGHIYMLGNACSNFFFQELRLDVKTQNKRLSPIDQSRKNKLRPSSGKSNEARA